MSSSHDIAESLNPSIDSDANSSVVSASVNEISVDIASISLSSSSSSSSSSKNVDKETGNIWDIRSLFAQRAPSKVLLDRIFQDSRWPSYEFQLLLVNEVFVPYSSPPREASSVWLHSVLKQLQADIEERKLHDKNVNRGNDSSDDDELEVSDELVELLIKNQSRFDEKEKEISVQTFFTERRHDVNSYLDFDCHDRPFRVVAVDQLDDEFAISANCSHGLGPGTSQVCIRTLRTHNQVGTRIWEAGLLLSEVFAAMDPRALRHRHIYELGAGAGVTGLMISRYHPSTVVTMSDYSKDVVANLEYNVKVNVESDIEEGNQLDEEDGGEVVDDGSISSLLTRNSKTISSDQCFYMSPDGLARVEVFDWFYPSRVIASTSFGDSRPLTDTTKSNEGASTASNTVLEPVAAAIDAHDPFYPIDLLIAADCTYSTDMNPYLAKVLMGRLPTSLLIRKAHLMKGSAANSGNCCNGSNNNSNNSSSGSYSALIALVTCTVRNEDTFSHFISCLEAEKTRLNDDSVLSYEWDFVRIKEEALRPHLGPARFYYPNRERIELIKIFIRDREVEL